MERRRSREVDYLNWILGRYVAIAFNSPKKYPDRPLLSKSEEEEQKRQKTMSDEEMSIQMRKNFILARGIDKSRKKDGTNS